jgi:hypothetical protein
MAKGKEKSRITVWLPLEDRARLDLQLYSDLESRVPLGAYTEFFSARVREHLEWATLDLTALGFPPGYFVRGPKEMVERLRLVLEQEHSLKKEPSSVLT